MIALLLMLGCADGPVVDSAEPVAEWLYGSEVVECSPNTLDARVALPALDDLRLDIWQCIEAGDGSELCMSPGRMEWDTAAHEVWASCQHAEIAAEGAYIVVDWMAPNPEW